MNECDRSEVLDMLAADTGVAWADIPDALAERLGSLLSEPGLDRTTATPRQIVACAVRQWVDGRRLDLRVQALERRLEGFEHAWRETELELVRLRSERDTPATLLDESDEQGDET